MTRRRLLVDDAVAQETLRLSTAGLGLWCVLLGAITIAGGAERWSAAQFATALQFPGAPESVGAAQLAVGLLALGGAVWRRRRAVAAGLFGGGVVNAFFAITTGHAAATVPAVAWTSPTNYACLTLAYLLVLAAYRDKDHPSDTLSQAGARP